MKRKTTWKIVAVTFLILGLANCFESKEDKDQDNTALLTLLNATRLEVTGYWDYFNGTPDYPGDMFNSPGTVKSGEFYLDNQIFTQISGASVYQANIVEYNNTTQTIYVQFTQHPFGAAGKFSAYYWTRFTDNKFYVCGDLSGNKNTLAEIKASAQVNDKTNMNSGCYTNNTFTPGVGFTWNRLEAK
ncbi:hypothetical protein CH379_018590 [Leptospira ellisii]|uniref:Lipoprotein n=1 Tax=Leptospira ellisii TaxID=2023197 RepID=A0A2N0BCK0_9LEPT|nr:hypothetical protein [Leptospira ellisii]MDV6237645.1 hypothetical protein [Leptospira ellisii]PJZ94235.1 hypothetical protein CH379_03585 [Leptospira ellisii]